MEIESGNRIVSRESVRSLRNDGKGSTSLEGGEKEKTDETIGEKERMKHTERYHSANGSREIVEGRFKDSNRTARQTKQNRAEAGIN